MRRRTTLIAALGCALAVASCDTSEPEPEYFTTVEYFVDSNQKAALVAEIASATTRIDAALTTLEDTEIANALVAAKNRGVTVRVAADEDFSGSSGMEALEAADIPVTYGDGSMLYLPEPTIGGIIDDCGQTGNLVVCPPLDDHDNVPLGAMYRPGSSNLQSHNFFIIDKRTVWTFVQPFDGSSGPNFGYRAESERMREVFVREFNQLFSGVFATTLDVYNGPVKSMPQNNPDFNAQSYLTDKGELEVRFNPQDRLTKVIIDDTYRAEAAVYIVTDNLAEDYLIDALRYKATARRPDSDSPAFDVRIIVNDAAQSDITRDDLEEIGNVRYAPEGIDRLPTIAIYDAVATEDGDQKPRRVHVASQPLWRSSPFDILRPGDNSFCPSSLTADCIVVHPADYFVDGHMWSLVEYRGQIGEVEDINRMKRWFDDLWSQSREP